MSTFPAEVMRSAQAAVDAWMAPDRAANQTMAEMVALVVMQDRAARVRSGLGLTSQQHKALTFIDGYIADHGYAPQFDEIRVALGISAKSGVSRIVDALVERGHIRRMPYRARSIQIVSRAA